MSQGWNEEVTDCCNVSFEWSAGTNNLYKKCPKCGDGTYFFPADTHFAHHPSDYEKSLEDRIAALELKFLQTHGRLG